ncbi:molybdenum cofactor guanylyltransferase [Methylophilaceae bacterium]|nr:molybdenum cofactor guanylyltransferase [Methylophilaceae bacterium]
MNIEIEGVILAGGQSKRMGTNKSLIELHNKPLIEHVYDRLIEQVSDVSINTNQPIKIFPKNIQFQDRILNNPGPLAGIQAGLFYAKQNWVQFCPNDCPFLPINLVEKLSFCIKDKGPTIILPSLFDRLEPVFMLCHRSLLKNLDKFISSGERKMELWIKENNYKAVNFSDPKAFVNINTHSELSNIEKENK